MPETAILVACAFFVPPLAVWLASGDVINTVLSIALCLLTLGFGGIIHAMVVIIIYRRRGYISGVRYRQNSSPYLTTADDNIEYDEKTGYYRDISTGKLYTTAPSGSRHHHQATLAAPLVAPAGSKLILPSSNSQSVSRTSAAPASSPATAYQASYGGATLTVPVKSSTNPPAPQPDASAKTQDAKTETVVTKVEPVPA